MTKKAKAAELEELHGGIANLLNRLVSSGDLDATRLAITFLKNNGITSDPAQDAALGELRETLQKQRIDQRLKVINSSRGDA
jgi:hypothetical protein